MSAADTDPTAVKDLADRLRDVKSDLRDSPISSGGKKKELCKADNSDVHEGAFVLPDPGIARPLEFTARDYIARRLDIASDLISPKSPTTSPPPAIYFSPLSNYKPPRTTPEDRELYYDKLMARFTACAMETFKSVKDEEPNLAYQSIRFAESALEHHNNGPNNKVLPLYRIICRLISVPTSHFRFPSDQYIGTEGVKYELIKPMESTYMLEPDSAYGHVNFTARQKKDGSSEELFFAELCMQEDITLTCFRCIKEKEDSIGGRLVMDREGQGVDTEHCYACGESLKHPKDGASYQAGHCLRPRYYEFP